MTNKNNTMQETLASLREVSKQLEKLAKLKLEQTSKEVANYASMIEREQKRRGR